MRLREEETEGKERNMGGQIIHGSSAERQFEAVFQAQIIRDRFTRMPPDRKNERPCCGSNLRKTAVEYILEYFAGEKGHR